jgi:hypothetical protein
MTCPLPVRLYATYSRLRKFTEGTAAMISPGFFQFMGPQHPGYIGKQGPSWQHPDTANSTSIKPFYFHGVWPSAWWIAWSLYWQPASNGTSKARLVTMDMDGPGYGNWRTLVEFAGPPNRGPMISGVGLTDVFNAMIAERRDQYIGFQMWDDGIVAYTLWESRLEMNLYPPTTAALAAKRVAPKLAEPGRVIHADATDLLVRMASLPRPPAEL